MNAQDLQNIKDLLTCGQIVRCAVHGLTRTVVYTIRDIKKDSFRTMCGGTIPICNVAVSNCWVERRVPIHEAVRNL